jgi:Skp family chaperone for outer membrane proteins
MKKLIFASALSALALPVAAQAQQLPPPVIAVVNTEQVFETCTACAAANTQLQAQGTQLQQRAQQLSTQIQTEGTALQGLVNALPQGQQPDAALAARIQTFQTLQQNADQEINAGRERIQRNLAFVRQQIGQRIRPALTTVMQQRGATLVLDRGGVLDASPTLDITAAVLAIVNQNTAPLNVNAPAPAQQPAAQRPATPQPAQPNRPRPQGR